MNGGSWGRRTVTCNDEFLSSNPPAVPGEDLAGFGGGGLKGPQRGKEALAFKCQSKEIGEGSQALIFAHRLLFRCG